MTNIELQNLLQEYGDHLEVQLRAYDENSDEMIRIAPESMNVEEDVLVIETNFLKVEE